MIIQAKVYVAGHGGMVGWFGEMFAASGHVMNLDTRLKL